MKITLYQIDAFAEKVFQGNPAAVCILDQWIDSALMQQIAQENNLAETAFVVQNNAHFQIRWFTPETEVALCGHATLAAAYVLFNDYGYPENTIRFSSRRNGELTVSKGSEGYMVLDFPADDYVFLRNHPDINKAIGLAPQRTIKGKTDYLLIYDSQDEIEAISPNFFLLAQIKCRGIMVSAPGKYADFVSRFFAPQCGIPEDPVTGSAYTTMVPYWSQVLGKTQLTAQQLSKRGGKLICELQGKRVKIAGKAVPYMVGQIKV